MAYAPSACYAGPAACTFALQIGGRGGLRCRSAQEFGGRGGGATHEGHMQSYGSQTDAGVAAGLKFLDTGNGFQTALLTSYKTGLMCVQKPLSISTNTP